MLWRACQLLFPVEQAIVQANQCFVVRFPCMVLPHLLAARPAHFIRDFRS